jgi:hypothetical protein
MSAPLALRYLAYCAVAGLAVLRPSFAAAFFERVESVLARLAARERFVWIGCGLLVLMLRAVLLPLWPVPKPVIYDEFGYILGADTFARGRLTNPTHPLADFFESPYVLQRPTYESKYPPAQSVALAVGEAALGDPWFGVWLSCGVMMAALVWALQGWLPPGWALMGGLLAMPLAIDSYWMNSYWGGAVAATGGALVLGGYARVVGRNQAWYAVAMGVGMAILANSRPFEGLIFALPVAIALLFWKRAGGVGPHRRWKAVGIIAVVLIPALAATGWYNHAVTGGAVQLPFTEYARQYARIPLFNFQPLQAVKNYSNAAMADLHQNWEVAQWEKARTWQLIVLRFQDWKLVAATILGSSLMGLLVVLFIGSLWRDRRVRLPLICVLLALEGSFIEICYYQHYAGPVAVALLIVAVQALRHLREWTAAGRFLSRALPVLVVGGALASRGMVIVRHEPIENSQPRNAQRDRIAASLLSDQVNQHVVLVRYTGHQSPHEEWVYNGADIDGQDVIWAHDLGESRNAELIRYYKDRKIWLLEPDVSGSHPVPYP